MSSVKAALFFVYTIAGVFVIGTAFSHFWRSGRLLEEHKEATLKKTEPSTALAAPTETPVVPPAEEPPQSPQQ